MTAVLPVRIAADTDIMRYNPELLAAAGEGINDVMTVAGHVGQFDDALLKQSEGLTQIEELCTQANGQVSGERLFEALETPGFADAIQPVFALISRDLGYAGMNFIFGNSRKESGLSVQSIFRYKQEIQNPDTLRVVTRHIARHEFGHLLGLDQSTIRRHDNRGGVYTHHCTNECTMHQVVSARGAAVLADKLAPKQHAGFCADCVGVLRSHR